MTSTQPLYTTEEGLRSLKKEYEELKIIKIPEINARIERAKEFGDLSENAEYEQAKDERAFAEGRLRELEDQIRRAVLFEARQGAGHITVGSTVVVSRDGKEIEYTIVGANEADPSKGKVSNESPLGGAFLGRRMGETVRVQTPSGESVYTVVKIR